MSTIKDKIAAAIKTHDTELRDINKKGSVPLCVLSLSTQHIHENPELGWKEVKAHDNIVALLKAVGIPKVTEHAYGLETSFEAEYGEGGRLIVFNVEYDALPGIGHACGHNLITTGSIGAFLTVVDLLKSEKIPGRVRALGTPAEENGGGKIKLIDAGAYKNVDACLMSHPMGGDIYKGKAGIAYVTSVAIAEFKAIFTGKAAHAALAPQDGVNALDAAMLSYCGVSMLRQQIAPHQRIHGIVNEGGDAPNIIPNRSSMTWNVRGGTIKETKVLEDRVKNCFKGASIATGCSIEFEDAESYAEVQPNKLLCKAYSDFMAIIGKPQLGDDDYHNPFPGAYSTDQGNGQVSRSQANSTTSIVTQVCPGFHSIYNIPHVYGQSNHNEGFTAACITEEAYQATLCTAQGMASSAWKVLSDAVFAMDVKSEFEKYKESQAA